MGGVGFVPSAFAVQSDKTGPFKGQGRRGRKLTHGGCISEIRRRCTSGCCYRNRSAKRGKGQKRIKRAKGGTLHVHILEQKLAPVVHERPFDAARMPLQRLLYRLRLEPRAHGKVSSVQVAETGIMPHAHARIPEQHRAKVEGPNRAFATDSVEVAMSVGRE